jgi:hypothetical protein
MPHLRIPHTPTSSPQLRILRDESAPPYDGIPSARPRTEAVAMIPDAVFALHDGTAIAVYAVLANHADTDGKCSPSMKSLERSLGWTETRIRPAIKKLIDAGLVEIERRQLRGMSQPNIYRITINSANEQVPHYKAMGTSPQGTGTSLQGTTVLTVNTVPPVDPVPEEPEKVNTRSAAKKSSPNYTEAFERFWRSYPSGRGNKFPSFKHWQRMSDDDRDAAQLAIPKWKAAWGDPRFIPFCEKWLGERRWENAPPTGAKGEINHNAGGMGKWVG